VATAFAHEATLTNLGALPFGESFGPFKLEAVWGPAVLLGFEGAQTIGVTAVNGSMCLTQTSHTPLEGFLESMGSVLAGAYQ
jgi:hypothetical protein